MTPAGQLTLHPLTQPLPAAEGQEGLCGDVLCEMVGGHPALTRVRSTSPLKILTPRTAPQSKTIVLSSFGGGLLGGDRVPIRLRVSPGAALTVLTQSSGKVYRSTGDWSEQTVHATIENDGLLAILPDALSSFAGSKYRQIQRFDLAANANLVWLDSITAGRSACGERWAMSNLSSRTTITREGRPILCETLELNNSPIAIASSLRLGAFDVYAVLAIIGPSVADMAKRAAELVRATPIGQYEPLLAAVSPLAGGVVLRMLGRDLQVVRKLIFDLLSPLGTISGQHPWARKW